MAARRKAKGSAEPAPPEPVAVAPGRRSRWAAVLVLATVVVVVYLPSLENGFIDWDDGQYVTENPDVQHLSWSTVVWSFGFHSANWHPLTWLSHAVDCRLYGVKDARGHHLTSVFIHAVNAALVLIVLWRLTDRFWPAVAVAALFALHPLRVESVSWVSERKDLLCGLFFLLALWAYAAHAARPSVWRYLTVAAALAAALMSKPMAVTLPFVLLLLDWWPLRRLSWRSVLEKVPLLALAAGSSYLTFRAQAAFEAVRSAARVGLADRLANAVVAYAAYLGRVVRPAPGRLLPLYMHPSLTGKGISVVAVAVSAAFLVAITAVAIHQRRRRPYLLMGWLWFLGMMVPVIGLVQVGWQASADRYTYLPLLGPAIGVVWLVAEWAASSAGRRQLAATALAVALVALTVLAWRQQVVWSDTVTVWRHTIQGEPESFKAHLELGIFWHRQERHGEAIACFRDAIRLKPDYPDSYTALGVELLKMGRLDEAAKAFAEVDRRAPVKTELRARGRYLMGLALLERGRPADAERELRAAIELRRGDAKAHNDLGIALRQQDRLDEAVDEFARAVALAPEVAQAQFNLGNALMQKGDLDGAEEHFAAAAELDPTFPPARANLGSVLLRKKRFAAAADRFREVLRLAPNMAEAHVGLSEALEALGQAGEAREHLDRARELKALEQLRSPAAPKEKGK